MKALICALLVFLVAASQGSRATVFEEAQEKYHVGDFVAAAEQARALADVEAKVLASRSYLAMAGYVANNGEAQNWLNEALVVSAEAVAINPDHVEAILYRVIAVGYHSRTLGDWKAHRAGFGREAQDLANRAIELQPESAWAQIVYSGWHAEIVAGAGSFMARLMYGASAKKAIAACNTAIELEPDGLAFRVECARTLMRLNAKKHHQRVVEHLQKAMALAPQDRFEELVQGQGRQLLAAMESGNKKEIKRVFRALDAFRQQGAKQ